LQYRLIHYLWTINTFIIVPIKKRNKTELFIEQFTIYKINGRNEMKTKERRVNQRCWLIPGSSICGAKDQNVWE